MKVSLLFFYLFMIFVILFVGITTTKRIKKTVKTQEIEISNLKVEIRDMKRAEPWLLLLHTNLPEIRKMELDCVAEALKQKLEMEAKGKCIQK